MLGNCDNIGPGLGVAHISAADTLIPGSGMNPQSIRYRSRPIAIGPPIRR